MGAANDSLDVSYQLVIVTSIHKRGTTNIHDSQEIAILIVTAIHKRGTTNCLPIVFCTTRIVTAIHKWGTTNSPNKRAKKGAL